MAVEAIEEKSQELTKSEIEEKRQEVTRSEIEVLVLVTGLVMMPLLYLWQTALGNLTNLMPVWENYLTSQLGSQYTSEAVIASYFTPFGLSVGLPIDLVLWAYDIVLILNTVALLIFGTALVAIDKHDVRRVEILMQKGKNCLDLVLTAIIFFATIHLLNNTLFPFKLLMGLEDYWVILVVGLASAVIVRQLLKRSINEILVTETHQKQSKA